MNDATMYERAMSTLVDYLCSLEEAQEPIRARERRATTLGPRPKRTPRARRPVETDDKPEDVLANASPSAVTEADLWIDVKAQEWQAQGRLTADGRLKLGHPVEPWTLDAIARLLPDLGEYDRVAVLIDLDGVVEEGWMDARRNIRAVIEEIVDIRVSALFGAVLLEMRSQGLDISSFKPPMSILRPSDGGPGGARRKRRRDPLTQELLEPEEYDRREQERRSQETDHAPIGG